MKFKLTTLTTLIALTYSTASLAALNGGTSTVADGASPNKSFSQTSFGAGLSAGLRFNLAEDIFFDSEEKKANAKDHIFTEVEAFGNQFFSGEIKQNFGGRINLGYEIKGIRIYGSGGYTTSTLTYQEQGKPSQSVASSAPFFGFGIGYDITKNVGIRLNSMFYNFDFKPKNSEFKSVEVETSTFNLGVGIYF